MALESERALQAALERARADATLTAMLPAGANGIHRQFAPDSSARPFVVVDILSAVDRQEAIGGFRQWQDTLVMTKACGVGTASWLGLRQIQDRLDALLNGYSTTVDGVYVVTFRRESAPPLPAENVGGVFYTQTAQVWRTEAEPSP